MNYDDWWNSGQPVNKNSTYSQDNYWYYYERKEMPSVPPKKKSLPLTEKDWQYVIDGLEAVEEINNMASMSTEGALINLKIWIRETLKREGFNVR